MVAWTKSGMRVGTFGRTCSLSHGRWIIALLVTLVGCGTSDWGYVKGTVTLDGAPVGPGTLIFEPADADRLNGPSAFGYFDAAGEYELSSAGKKKGAPQGNYRVLVMPGGPSSLVEESAAADRPKSPIPPRYSDYDAGLTAEIEAGNQTIDFPLTKSPQR